MLPSCRAFYHQFCSHHGAKSKIPTKSVNFLWRGKRNVVFNMNFEKIKYSKCPNCKKYGINSSGKIGIRVCIPVKCKYCKKIFVINSALRIIILIFSPLVGGGIAIFLQRFFDESSKFPDIIGLFAMIVVFLFCQHFAKLEELTDERELERLKEEDDEED